MGTRMTQKVHSTLGEDLRDFSSHSDDEVAQDSDDVHDIYLVVPQGGRGSCGRKKERMHGEVLLDGVEWVQEIQDRRQKETTPHTSSPNTGSKSGVRSSSKKKKAMSEGQQAKCGTNHGDSSPRPDEKPSILQQLPRLPIEFPRRKRRCKLMRVLAYLICGLIVLLAILGTVFLSLGAVTGDRDFLVAGSILSISCIGLFLHKCFRRSPNHVKGNYPMYVQQGVSVSPHLPEDPAHHSSDSEACVATAKHSRRSSVCTVIGEPVSPVALGGCPRCTMTNPRVLRHHSRRESSVLNLARRLSVVSNVGSGYSNGWQGSGGHRQHRFRRSISHPWEMSRPENHYREYV